MDNTKYVIVGKHGLERAIILDNMLSHDSIKSPDIVSAGFFTFKTGEDECGNPIIISSVFGKSVSLDVKSRPKDSKLIDRALNYWMNY